MGTGVMLGVTLRWTSIPSSGELKNTSSRSMLRKPGISTGVLGHWLGKRLPTDILPTVVLYIETK